ncbi:MAG: glycoside hydrolase family 95 protein [Kiritimatiellae bacterium]|nr:glycoside hydrolase family 95 protein [Kiritimatiellia bacterium]
MQKTRKARKDASRLCLWYRQPAGRWEEALPIGNGRLGGMVFGGIERDRIQLNEETVWAGPPVPQDVPGARRAIDRARRLLFKGRYAEAQTVLQNGALAQRIAPRSYQPLGDLLLTFRQPGKEGAKRYRRELALDTAMAATSFAVEGVTFTREAFCSAADPVVVVRLKAGGRGRVSCSVALTRTKGAVSMAVGRDTLLLRGQASHDGTHRGVRFEAYLKALVKGGSCLPDTNTLEIENAREVVLLLAAATDYNMRDPASPLRRVPHAACVRQVAAAARKGYTALRRDHLRAHRKLFGRVTLEFAGGSAAGAATDERLEAVRRGKRDVRLQALYFQYGRYLLICASRPGGLPANLQGIWNPHIVAPWNADFHTNINIQMNYWPAEVANLSECHGPLFDFVERLVPGGRRTARLMYGCRGFLAGHTTDAWLWTTPQGRVGYGMWVMGAAWCAQHFAEHYRFTGDRAFLRKRALPVLKEASQFFLDWLVPHPRTGKLVSGPATSPENAFRAPNGQACCASMGCAMDQEIVWDTFTSYLEAADALHVRDAFTRRVRRAREQLAVPRIGADGRLMEWAEPFEEPHPGHRHVSHLFGFHPGRQFTVRSAPEQVAAARRSLEYRLAHGGGHTGWSRAWLVNLWARFGDAEKAYENLELLLKKSTLPNLFDDHPPFQIDGNWGGCAAVAEMLLQSHDGEIHLLPALPKAWPNGSVRGLCARGGFTVDITWARGKLKRAVLRARLGGACRLRCGGKVREFRTRKGQRLVVGPTARWD